MSAPAIVANPDRIRERFLCLQRQLQGNLAEARASANEIHRLAKVNLPHSEDSLSAIWQADTLRSLIDVSYGVALEIGRPMHFATNLNETTVAENEKPGPNRRQPRGSSQGNHASPVARFDSRTTRSGRASGPGDGNPKAPVRVRL